MGRVYRGTGVVVLCCVWKVPLGCSCQINTMQCILEGDQDVVDKCIRLKYVPLCCWSGEKTVSAVVVGGG